VLGFGKTQGVKRRVEARVRVCQIKTRAEDRGRRCHTSSAESEARVWCGMQRSGRNSWVRSGGRLSRASPPGIVECQGNSSRAAQGERRKRETPIER
jgi:hypothetical protein